jgi:hypothetical protein
VARQVRLHMRVREQWHQPAGDAAAGVQRGWGPATPLTPPPQPPRCSQPPVSKSGGEGGRGAILELTMTRGMLRATR